MLTATAFAAVAGFAAKPACREFAHDYVMLNILPVTAPQGPDFDQLVKGVIEYRQRTGHTLVLPSLSFHPDAKDPWVKAQRLIDFYRALRKALASGEAALVEMRKFDERPNGYIAPVAVAFELKDYAKVDELLAAYKACFEKRKLKFPDLMYAQWAGDLAYYRGDYAKAVEHYSSVKELPRPQSAESHYNRYVGALYALGRYDEALKLVPKLIAWCSLADRNTLYKRILKAKAEAQKKEER